MSSSAKEGHGFGNLLCRELIAIAHGKEVDRDVESRIQNMELHLNDALKNASNSRSNKGPIGKTDQHQLELHGCKQYVYEVSLNDFFEATLFVLSLSHLGTPIKPFVAEYMLQFEASEFGFYCLLRDCVICGYEEEICDAFGALYGHDGLDSCIDALSNQVPIDDITT